MTTSHLQQPDQRLHLITTPLLLLNAYDDPIVPGASLNSKLTLTLTLTLNAYGDPIVPGALNSK